MKKKIKICGIQTAHDIAIVNQEKPDYIGYIFYPKSKRYITYAKAALLTHLLDDTIQSVGVFVNERISRVIQAVHTAQLDVIQLHGDEDAHYIQQLRNATDCQLVKVYRVGNSKVEFKELDVDYYLFDTNVREYGGTGRTFDWTTIQHIQTDKPVFLAGGIGPTNIKAALDMGVDGIDLSSSVEVDGSKDPILIRQVIQEVRRYPL